MMMCCRCRRDNTSTLAKPQHHRLYKICLFSLRLVSPFPFLAHADGVVPCIDAFLLPRSGMILGGGGGREGVRGGRREAVTGGRYKGMDGGE